MTARRRLPRPFVPLMTLGEAIGPASPALPLNSPSSLPISSSLSEAGSDSNNALVNKHTFRMSLPKFVALNGKAQRVLSSLLQRALGGLSGDNGDDEKDNEMGNGPRELYNPELWERCADTCDALAIGCSPTSMRHGGGAQGGVRDPRRGRLRRGAAQVWPRHGVPHAVALRGGAEEEEDAVRTRRQERGGKNREGDVAARMRRMRRMWWHKAARTRGQG